MPRTNKKMQQHHVIYDRLLKKESFTKTDSFMISKMQYYCYFYFQTLSKILKYITNDFHV